MIIVDYLNDMWQLARQGERQGIFFFAALYALFIVSYSLVYQLRVRLWPNVKGELLKAEVEKFGVTKLLKAEQNYVASALYQYKVDGTQYQGRRVSSWQMVASRHVAILLKKQLEGIEKYSDGSVKVFYNPRKPSKSYLIKPGILGVIITLVLALLPAILYLFDYPLSH